MFHALHGHQGRDRTISLIKRRFFWPGMYSYVRDRMRQCSRCVLRKSHQGGTAGFVNIVSSAPMEILCLDYLKVEGSKGGFEDVLVISLGTPMSSPPGIKRLEQRQEYCSITSSSTTVSRRESTATKARPLSQSCSKSCVISLGLRSLGLSPNILWERTVRAVQPDAPEDVGNSRRLPEQRLEGTCTSPGTCIQCYLP